jgi:hypothetical protein
MGELSRGWSGTRLDGEKGRLYSPMKKGDGGGMDGVGNGSGIDGGVGTG